MVHVIVELEIAEHVVGNVLLRVVAVVLLNSCLADWFFLRFILLIRVLCVLPASFFFSNLLADLTDFSSVFAFLALFTFLTFRGRLGAFPLLFALLLFNSPSLLQL